VIDLPNLVTLPADVNKANGFSRIMPNLEIGFWRHFRPKIATAPRSNKQREHDAQKERRVSKTKQKPFSKSIEILSHSINLPFSSQLSKVEY